MKQLIYLFLLSILPIPGFAQSKEISNNYDKIGRFVNGHAFVYKGNLVGMIDSTGKEVIKPEYERITAFGKDGIAYSYKKDKVGLINSNGQVLVENEYDYIGHFKAGRAIIRKNNLCGVVNKNGKIIVDIKYEKLDCDDNGIIKAINPDGSQVLVKVEE